MSEQNIDKKFHIAMENVNNLQKMFRTTGVLHNMVKDIGGDVAWFNDVNEAFDNLYDALEEAHMGAVAHLQMKDESVEVSETPNKPGYCSDDCCGAEVKAEDCNCPPDCKGCDCNADVKEETVDPELAVILQRSGL